MNAPTPSGLFGGSGRKAAPLAVIIIALILVIAAGVFCKKSRPDAPTEVQARNRVTTVTPEKTAPAGGDLVSPPPRAAQELEDLCRERLQNLAGALRVYRAIHDGQSPAQLSTLLYDGLVADTSVFVYADTAALPARKEIDEKTDFTVEPLPGISGVLVREKRPHLQPGKILAAMEDGSLKFFPVR